MSSNRTLGTLIAAAVAAVVTPPARADFLVSNDGTHSVLRFADDGTPLGAFAGGGHLLHPRGLAFGPDGNLFVADPGLGNVARFDGTTGAFLGTFTQELISIPEGLTFGPDGNLYVTSARVGGEGTVLRFDGTTGAPLGVAASGGGLNRPEGFAFVSTPFLLVASNGTGELLDYDSTFGTFVGAVRSGLEGPTGVLADSPFSVFIAEFDADRVTHLNGGQISTLSGGGLDGPVGLAFAQDGTLLVASALSNQVLRYDRTTGAFLGVAASGGGLDQPTYLTSYDFETANPVPAPSTRILIVSGALALLVRAWRMRADTPPGGIHQLRVATA